MTTPSPETDLVKLYSARILALAADIGLTDRLDAPDATAKKRAPLCGSTVTVDLKLNSDTITAFGQDVKACALGQASAAVLAQSVIGSKVSEVREARDALKDMLKNEGPAPTGRFEELKVLLPARDYKNRHASILLAFEATLEAAETAKAQDTA
ncbi:MULTISPECIES: iron-sulfur cluster assembly scaffold protein [Halocynthiibacter]|uniref:Iron-sulfur cluster assembly scaffold protein n=1 Tax=Halocynthiibacter halioticoli TaxID=2986804 RepID=A0AAE3IYA4_9RHOB|nr:MULTISPECIES: iron-sulfur cluster assembly scaffold protein [Halocynthiibacter]MCV6824328.1 iron-sulfur cluster assembly scaffold protein [Halocynthiibacter halioticoli]MCW4057329.1 iron-sulfur cluster assembly scaffold protein [Halocynthiibacter sp. SDUM655004]